MASLHSLRPVALAVGLFLAGCNQGSPNDPQRQTGANPSLPEPKHFLLPPMKVPEGVGWSGEARPTVAQGLKIEKIADGLQHPRQLLVLSNGDVLVVEANSPGTAPVTTPKQLIAGMVKGQSGKAGKGGNRITLLRRADGGGHWQKYVFLEGLDSPFGVQQVGNYLYVANTGNIMRYRYVPGETRIAGPGMEFTDLPDTINHHWTKALLASPDGRKLYVGVGSNSNITENGAAIEYRRAAILEVDVASRGSRIYASGLRNPTGLQWEPVSGKLWTIVNERDEIGNDLVPDYLTSVREGGFYGWPYSYFGQHLDPRVRPQRPDLVAKAIVPDYALGSHVAALGLFFYTGDQLPERYRNGAFVSEHGSWNRSPVSGFQVVHVPFVDGKPAGAPQPVVTGFVSADEKQLFGAPVGLAQADDGALLIADDVGNAIWRVSAAGAD
ncbi:MULTISPECIES: PQQ-dependent sugar dehydrogenase [Pseudomonas aeruginosa group]|uniref:PQQ-dependent sugar dehydrogenase n=1 Tax=Pseudomonas aeruginosa group TaxID=136841 RepID=UPI0006B27C19|nr:MULTISPECIES: sorbosone dehydrogenase family protein [Pseudomonas aeruginosa group]KPD25657.1 L-sorbosone dehydrogenase [Pseudomonas paraeruginosa]KQB30893.1 L-sorbosone dehydrogenase [Pseudomonas paraeruginosa]MDT1024404.1 sorbosone dehydrogenase family protein [Pseudomonas paraeruginosa]PHJ28921.1 L-sorbosone dehydrogenase [Pseudomonas paraeruginosa]QQV51338.1 sorbosone dehydrogenase family protein [Pseudomonas aeruginosa]